MHGGLKLPAGSGILYQSIAHVSGHCGGEDKAGLAKGVQLSISCFQLGGHIDQTLLATTQGGATESLQTCADIAQLAAGFIGICPGEGIAFTKRGDLAFELCCFVVRSTTAPLACTGSQTYATKDEGQQNGAETRYEHMVECGLLITSCRYRRAP